MFWDVKDQIRFFNKVNNRFPKKREEEKNMVKNDFLALLCLDEDNFEGLHISRHPLCAYGKGDNDINWRDCKDFFLPPEKRGNC